MSIWNRGTRFVAAREWAEVAPSYSDFQYKDLSNGLYNLTIEVHDKMVSDGVFRNRAPKRGIPNERGGYTGGVYHQLKYALTTQNPNTLSKAQLRLQSQMRFALYEAGWLQMRDIVALEEAASS